MIRIISDFSPQKNYKCKNKNEQKPQSYCGFMHQPCSVHNYEKRRYLNVKNVKVKNVEIVIWTPLGTSRFFFRVFQHNFKHFYIKRLQEVKDILSIKVVHAIRNMQSFPLTSWLKLNMQSKFLTNLSWFGRFSNEILHLSKRICLTLWVRINLFADFFILKVKGHVHENQLQIKMV